MHEYAKRKNGPEGWFDVRSHLCIWLGERLEYMSKHHRTYPEGMTHDEWSRELGKHAYNLLDHGKRDAEGDADSDTTRRAKESLGWVALNLESLWD
jgi:hypothetical protein